ncbi:peptidylprolyl cis-trans isomerase, PpiC-type, SurA family [Geotalea daltonii FRC-32]|uniref:Peptidylprolyl cis-trans isomerase, PpiC-type, SurA family n=1 Tax=Geotalea daltonii (strain DSM 22248 / JCM 15807 / FRC-32) TaxID=316067 RepID=B9M731_GEODF|nr:peptidylprolyl isomerase [Geotalea daltonii]ACM22052.1 peptidylprolyl cis-trans isomerase, PpiC-type, SurA family [Geotalea daltonii FRC-32]
MNKFLLYFAVSVLFICPAAAKGELITAVAAIVNDDVITTLEVQKETDQIIKEMEKKGPAETPDKAALRKIALDRLIDKKLVEQKIKELDIKVPEEELRQSIEDVKKQNNLTQEALVAALAGQGLSFEQYKTQLREQLERLRLMSQEVRSKIQVGEREIREYYEANHNRYGEEEFFRARHIFFKVGKDAPESEAAKVMTTATQVLQEARSGKDFAELARQFSDDPAAKKDGGDLGTFKKGDMIGEIEAAVSGMKPGEVSDPVKTAAGFHIIKLEERSKGKPRPFEEVKAEIEDLLYKKKSEERFNQWVNDLRKGAAIEIKL